MKYRLKDVGKIVGGGTPSTKHKEYFTIKGLPWITPKDLRGLQSIYISKGARDITHLGYKNSGAKLLPKNTVLISSRAPIGYVAIAHNTVTTNQGFKSIIPNTKIITSMYLYYLIYSNVKKLKIYAAGSTFKELSGRELGQIQFNIPSLQIQNKITYILSSLDNKITLNKQINKNLIKLANLIFLKKFSNSYYGTDTLGKHLNIYDRKRVPLSKRVRSKIQGKYRYIGPTSVLSYINKFNFKGTYVLLGEDGTVHDNRFRPIVHYIWGKFWPNNHTHVLRGKDVSNEWLYLFLKNVNVKGIITGAVQQKINQRNLKSIHISIPSKIRLKRFQQIINPMFKQLKELSKQNITLNHLKHELLLKFFN